MDTHLNISRFDRIILAEPFKTVIDKHLVQDPKHKYRNNLVTSLINMLFEALQFYCLIGQLKRLWKNLYYVRLLELTRLLAQN